jgi:hypothetical protein
VKDIIANGEKIIMKVVVF